MYMYLCEIITAACLYPVLSSDEDSELLGHLTVSVCALDVLQHLS